MGCDISTIRGWFQELAHDIHFLKMGMIVAGCNQKELEKECAAIREKCLAHEKELSPGVDVKMAKKKLKVWGGRFFIGGDQGRRIVAAYTKKQATELAGISYRELTEYWSETGNATELSVATEPGVWDQTKAWSADPKDYIRVK
jgi:hypothetical protein